MKLYITFSDEKILTPLGAKMAFSATVEDGANTEQVEKATRALADVWEWNRRGGLIEKYGSEGASG
jgi:hypothetical protein